MGYTWGKMECGGCQSYRISVAVPWLIRKAWHMQGEHYAAHSAGIFLTLATLPCELPSSLRATKLN